MKFNVNKDILKNVSIILLLVVIAVASFGKIRPVTTDVNNHEEVIASIDKEIETVLKLTGGAVGASAVISMLPDDSCTPIAEQLAELSQYFLIVLSALYLEKYLISLVGYVSFSFLIPVGCVVWGFGHFFGKAELKVLAYKLAISALAIYLMIPLSVKASNLIYANYENSIESTIDEADRITIAQDTEDSSLLDKVTSWIENAAVTLSDYVTGLLSNFVDALAIMIVTSCLIPVMVFVFICWLIKLMFNVQIPINKICSPKIGMGKAIEKKEDN